MNFVEKRPVLPPDSSRNAAIAFERVKDEMAALHADELVRINVDIPRAVATALGALPALIALRPTIVKTLPTFPLEAIDKLETYALAAYYAHIVSLSGDEADNEYAALVEEATALRRTLLVAAEALAHRGLLDSSAVARIRSGQGHLDLAGDLVALADSFRDAWPAVGTKTAITRAEVDRAASLASLLMAAIGARSSKKREPSIVKDQRRRAYTLLARAYDECRRAVSYLRWSHGDAGTIVPAFAGPRSKRKKRSASAQPPSRPAAHRGCQRNRAWLRFLATERPETTNSAPLRALECSLSTESGRVRALECSDRP